MTPGVLNPTSTKELIEVVRSTERVIAVGAGTKPRLAQVDESYSRVSLLQLRGIVEYEPSEYTITALAGTPVLELASVLAEKGQYLPSDPLLRQSGATLGGTIAANTNGPGRFRFGGARDFVLGAQFIDGAGRLLRAGGKVVKNAAGFDVPKFLAGSLGRFCVLTEITLKVLPAPAATLTVRLNADSFDVAVRLFGDLGRSRWQVDALDVPPSGGSILVRLTGPPSALTAIANEILGRWTGEILPQSEADKGWSDLVEMRWAPSHGVLLKLPLTLSQLPSVAALVSRIPEARLHVSGGGNVAFLWLPSADPATSLDKDLQGLGLTALVLRGQAPLWLGRRQPTHIADRVKDAFDPQHRYPLLEDAPLHPT